MIALYYIKVDIYTVTMQVIFKFLSETIFEVIFLLTILFFEDLCNALLCLLHLMKRKHEKN